MSMMVVMVVVVAATRLNEIRLTTTMATAIITPDGMLAGVVNTDGSIIGVKAVNETVW
jgi:hypothetical protein